MNAGSRRACRRRIRNAVAAGLLCWVAAAQGVVRYPHHVAWRGTLVDSQGNTMTLRAHAHLRYGRDIGPEYPGRMRCIGTGCPFRRGSIEATPEGSAIDVINLVTFGRRGLYCVHLDHVQNLTDFAVSGSYTCDTTATKTQPARRVSEGTISLLRYRRPAR